MSSDYKEPGLMRELIDKMSNATKVAEALHPGDKVAYDDKEGEDSHGFASEIAKVMKGTIKVEVDKITGDAAMYNGDVTFHFNNGKELEYKYKMGPSGSKDVHEFFVDGKHIRTMKTLPDDHDWIDMFHENILK